MIFLAACIICNTLIFVIFKLFARFKVDNFQAIVVNYFTAALLGFILLGDWNAVVNVPQKSWFSLALLVGAMFISLFYVIALTTQKVSISAASVAGKMSLVIPTIAAFIWFGEFDKIDGTTKILRITGIAMAIVGVYFTAMSNGKDKINTKYLYLPIILFFGSGVLDTLMGYAESNYLSGNDAALFTPTLFVIAALIGTTVIGFKVFSRNERVKRKNVIAGILLGIPNYGSIYFLLKTLEIDSFDRSQVFPINNMAIVGLSALVALFLFREKLTSRNWIGIGLSILAIGLITFDQLF